MNEKFPFKICVRFDASLDMGENILHYILYGVMYKNAGTKLQPI